MGHVVYNKDSQKLLDRALFEGKSEGVSAGWGPVGGSVIVAYDDNKYHPFTETTRSYTAWLIGYGAGAPMGLQYSQQKSKHIMSIPVSRYINFVPPYKSF